MAEIFCTKYTQVCTQFLTFAIFILINTHITINAQPPELKIKSKIMAHYTALKKTMVDWSESPCSLSGAFWLPPRAFSRINTVYSFNLQQWPLSSITVTITSDLWLTLILLSTIKIKLPQLLTVYRIWLMLWFVSSLPISTSSAYFTLCMLSFINLIVGVVVLRLCLSRDALWSLAKNAKFSEKEVTQYRLYLPK